VMELFEMILIEIVKKASRADRMCRDLEIVDVPFPVIAYFCGCCHRPNYNL